MSYELWPWPMIGAALAGAVLLLTLWVNFGRPVRRRWLLKKPAKAFFHVRSVRDGPLLGYLYQNDKAHNVKELVLPSNSEVEIEVSYNPTISFNVGEVIFAIDGELDVKPSFEERLAPFVARRVSGKDDHRAKDYWDRKGNYHIITSNSGRSVGSSYTAGFRLRTRNPGVFTTSIGLLTDEVDGNLDGLVLRIEDSPTTKMRCIEHKKCQLEPVPKVTQ